LILMNILFSSSPFCILIWLILSNCFLLILLKIQLLLESSLSASVCLSTENLQKEPVCDPTICLSMFCHHLPLNECCSLLCQSTTASSSFWVESALCFHYGRWLFIKILNSCKPSSVHM
jgi:hypothetical protein